MHVSQAFIYNIYIKRMHFSGRSRVGNTRDTVACFSSGVGTKELGGQTPEGNEPWNACVSRHGRQGVPKTLPPFEALFRTASRGETRVQLEGFRALEGGRSPASRKNASSVAEPAQPARPKERETGAQAMRRKIRAGDPGEAKRRAILENRRTVLEAKITAMRQ